MNKDYLKIGKYKLNSRLIVGTGKYKSFKETADAIKANSITSSELNFVPTDSTNVIASIRASNESLIIQGNKIEIVIFCF